MKLTLPLPPNRANAREHWRVTHRKKKEYYERAEMVIWAQLSGLTGVDRARAFNRQRMRLAATFYLWNKMDRGNMVARLKFIEDILVRCALLGDDNEEWLDLQMPKQVIDRKDRRVEIVLVPCDGKPKGENG